MRQSSLSLLLLMGMCFTANAQIDTGETNPIPGGADVDSTRLPSILSLIEVTEPEASYYQASGVVRVMVKFDARVSNAGGVADEYLILATATGGPSSVTSKPHRIESGQTARRSQALKSEFNCFGADRFAVTISLVDQWDGLDSRGQPIRPRALQSVTKWIDTPEYLVKSTSETFDCSGKDPFAAGSDIDAEIGTAKMTPFNPFEHGFNFDNSFSNNMGPALDIRTGGLCGGMMYSALDYYYASREIPQQDYRPADHATLYRYLYDRQSHSIYSNIDQWSELTINIGGSRDSQVFSWGLGERLDDIREYIDRGEPVVLGLKGANGSGDHQVIAVGYDLGRYRRDSGEFKEDIKIFTHDPNFPNEYMTLVPDLEREIYYYTEFGSVGTKDEVVNYRGYFVDKNYHRESPPPILNPVYPDDGLVHELVIRFDTGNDDLRGGGHADVTIIFNDGSTQVMRDVNGGRRWLENYDQTISIPLDTPTSVDNLRELRIEHRSGGPGGPDNWNVDDLLVSARGFERHIIYDLEAAPLVRFTDDNRGFIAYLNTGFVPDAHVRQLNFTFSTGGDDLRGGNDNLDVEIMYNDGRIQRARAINGFLPWENHTTANYPVALAEPGPLSDIRGVRLIKSPGNDNWNLDALRIEVVPERDEKYIVLDEADSPLWPFTGSRPVREFVFEP